MRIRTRFCAVVSVAAALFGSCFASGAEQRENRVIEIPGDPALSYGDGTAEEKGSPAGRDILDFHPELRLSPSLSKAAAAIVELRSEMDWNLPPEIVDLVLKFAGCVDPTAVATVIPAAGSGGVASQIGAILAAAPEPFTHVGIAGVPGGEGAMLWGVVLTRRLAEVEALPTSVDLGEEARVGFTLAAGLDLPAVVVTLPGGTIVRPELRALEEGWEFRTNLGRRPGTAWIHLLADSERGQVMAAQMSVAVGGPPVSSWTPPPRVEEPPQGDVSAATAAMVRLVNRDRRRFGLPALAPDPKLMRVALDHTVDMSRTGLLGHESPTRGGLVRRLEEVSYPKLAARENLSRAETVLGAQAALMMSPAHRANLLSADVTRLGVGVVVDEGQGGRGGYLITQVFARPRVLPTGDDLRAQVRARLEAARRLKGWPQPAPSPELDRAASQVAEASSEEGRLSTEAMEWIKVDLFLSEVEWKAMRVDYHRVEGPEGVAFSDEALSPLTRTVGIGVAKTGDDGLPGRWVVVLVLLRR